MKKLDQTKLVGAFALVMAVAGTTRAEILSGSAVVSSVGAAGCTGLSSAVPSASGQLGWLADDVREVFAGVAVPANEPTTQLTPSQELPAPPGSASLFLAAVGSLGAWQLTRSVRRLHSAAVPDWFHTGGPRQIGYRFAIDITRPTYMPLCDSFDQPIVQPVRAGVIGRLTRIRGDALCFLTPANPRGPPETA